MYAAQYFLFLIYGFIVSVTVVSGNDLQKCVLMGDPHIQMFHSVNVAPPPYKDCLNEGLLTVVKAPLVTLIVDVSNWWMIELYFTFRNQSNMPSFCSISSYNFIVSDDNDFCSTNGVSVVKTDEYWWWTISVYYPAANFSAVITYYKYWVNHYNIEIWMLQDAATSATGVCSRPGCSNGNGRKRSARSIGLSVNNETGISNETAGQICDAYIQAYLATLQRQPSQRDVHYNGTIESVRSMCVFDVATAGHGAASAALQILMIEETTTGVTNLSEVQPTFQRNINQAFAVVVQTINATEAEVMEIINSTNTQAPIISTITSTTDGSGTPTISSSGSRTTTSSSDGSGTTTSSSAGSRTTTISTSGSRTTTSSSDGSGTTTSSSGGSGTTTHTILPPIPSAASGFSSPAIYMLLFVLSSI